MPASEASRADDNGLILETLTRNEILAQLPEDRIERIAAVSRILLFGQNEQIIREKEEGQAFHILLSGQVDVFRKGQCVTTLGAGDYFGEMALFTGEKTSATVIAQNECRILRIGAKDFRDLTAMSDQMAQAISDVIARRRARNIEQDEEWTKRKKSSIHSESASLFKRIKRYFELSEPETRTDPTVPGQPPGQR